MLERMKKLPISGSQKIEIFIYENGVKKFYIPLEKAKALIALLSEFQVNAETVSSEEVFKDLDQEFGRAGAALQGARLKEGLTQVELAAKLNISQTDLSKMEHGKRTIGKKMAKKFAEVLNLDYRVFL